MSGNLLFIVGSPRSGTSSLHRLVLDKFRYAGDTEGHITPIIQKIREINGEYFTDNADVGSSEPNTISRIGTDWIVTAIFQRFREIVLTDVEVGWSDKTPGVEAIRAAGSVHHHLPDAKIIYIQRNGYHNIQSRLKKFPHVAFEDHCKQWTREVTAWRRTRSQLPNDCYLEFDLEDLGDHTSVVRRLEAFLGVASVDTAATAVVVERSASDNAPKPWSAQRRRIFERLCGPMMLACGYEMPFDREEGAPVNVGNMQVSDGNLAYLTTDDAGMWLFLHPGTGDQFRTTAILRQVEVADASCFRTRLRHSGSDSANVQFTITFRGRSGVIRQFVTAISAQTEREWREDLDLPAGPYDLEISSEVVGGGNNARCWTQLLVPTLAVQSKG